VVPGFGEKLILKPGALAAQAACAADGITGAGGGAGGAGGAGMDGMDGTAGGAGGAGGAGTLPLQVQPSCAEAGTAMVKAPMAANTIAGTDFMDFLLID